MGIKTKKFSQLSATSDGKLILANDNKLYQSTSSLSELIPNVDNLASKELVQETSATITGMIPSTAGLATETDLQTVSGALSNYEQKITYGYDENEAITAINNSAIGGTGGGGDYVPLSANEVNIGNDNTLTLTGLNKCILMQGSGNNIDTSYSTPAFIQGTNNTAMDASFCQGSGNNSQQRALTQGKYNSGYYIALSQGETNKASYIAFSQGKSNSSYSASFTQGSGNSALCMGFAQGKDNLVNWQDAGGLSHDYKNSFAQGELNSARYISFAQGDKNYAENRAFAQGSGNSAYSYALAQGNNNSAKTYALAQGSNNSAYSYSLAQGNVNSAIFQSFAQGYSNKANYNSLAQGGFNNASGYSIAQGDYNTASNYSQAFGKNTKATNSGMAIGTYNETDSAAFVIGNGTSNAAKSDAFIIFHDGSVSAAGKISADGVELGAGGNEGDELINKTCTIEGTTATVTLDNNNYNIIDTINATVTDLNINIQTSTPKYQKCWFEYDVAKNSVLTGVKSYVNNSEVPISCPSSYDSDKIYQGYSINYLTTINSIDKISPFGTVEVGGRSYKTVKMGNREWMAENLDYPYSEITIGSTSSPTEPRANYYNNDSATYNYEGNKYGLLYNMPALLKMSNDGQFPTGWRLPTTADFQDLFTYIGSSSWATKLCSTAWNNGTDDYGFNMLPAGYRHDSTFSSVNTRTRYWTITVGRNSYIYYMIGTDNSIGSASDVTALNKNQYPVRLVKTI